MTSQYFKISRGLRQGDPLSSYIFVLCVEILAIAVRNNDDIQGIEINENVIKIAQYADDTTAILKDVRSARNFLQLLERFSKISGLKINKEKTEALWLGRNKFNISKPLGIKWSQEPIKVLGVYICTDSKKVIEANFSLRIKKLKQQINIWKQRNLSLIGKVLILKTFGISQFIYLAGLLPFPTCKMKEINQIMYEFVWNGKTDKVKRNVLIQDYCHGGIKMPDIASINIVQKIRWITQAISNHEAFWPITMKQLIGIKNLSVFLYSNFHVKDFEDVSPFYYEVLTCFRSITMGQKEEFGNQLIYYNKNIKVNKTYVYDSKLLQSGIWKICDLYEDDRIIPFHVLQRRGVPFSCYMTWRSIIDIVNKKVTHPILCNRQPCSIYVLQNDVYREITDLNSRSMYNLVVSMKKETPAALEKICRNLEMVISDQRKEDMYGCFWTFLYDNRIKEFQFKLLHRILGTNNFIYKIGKTDTPRCDFCNIYLEKIEHLFFLCTHVKQIWLEVERLSREVLALDVKLRMDEVLLGYELHDKSDMNILLNKLILYGKHYIWKTKLSNLTLSVTGFYKYLEGHVRYDKILTIICAQIPNIE